MSVKITAERTRDEVFGLAGVILTLPDGRRFFLTMADIDRLKAEVEEYDKENR